MKMLICAILLLGTIHANALNVNSPKEKDKEKIILKVTPLPDSRIGVLNSYLGGVLENKGDIFVKYSTVYRVDPYLVVAIAMLESNNGTSTFAVYYHNIGGLYGNSGKASTFDSVEKCIEYLCMTLRTMYYDEGLTTTEEIGPKYCPVWDPRDTEGTNSQWSRCVKNIMKEFDEK